MIDLNVAKNSLLGTAIGDSLGLPYEGLPPRRAQKLMPFPLRQRLLVRRGAVSDDTVQSGLVLAAMKRANGDIEEFRKDLGKSLRKWFLSIPPGIGLATIKASLRLCLGVPASRSGVNSAGNGAAMRAAVIGAALHDDPIARVKFVEASSRITHAHPDAIAGAQLIALAAALMANNQIERFSEEAIGIAPGWKSDLEWSEKGPTGYVIQSVNAAMSIVSQPGITLSEGIEKAISLGGDTDTIAAMVGGILAARAEPPDIEERWLRYMGWPSPIDIENESLSPTYLRLLGQHLVALPAILAFGFRRLLPPF